MASLKSKTFKIKASILTAVGIMLNFEMKLSSLILLSFILPLPKFQDLKSIYSDSPDFNVAV